MVTIHVTLLVCNQHHATSIPAQTMTINKTNAHSPDAQGQYQRLDIHWPLMEPMASCPRSQSHASWPHRYGHGHGHGAPRPCRCCVVFCLHLSDRTVSEGLYEMVSALAHSRALLGQACMPPTPASFHVFASHHMPTCLSSCMPSFIMRNVLETLLNV